MLEPVRVLLGAVDSTTVRALVLTKLPHAPIVSIRGAGGEAVRISVAPPPVSNDLRDQLARLGLRVFLARADGFTAGTSYELTIDQGLSRPIRFRTCNPDSDAVKIVVASCYYDYFHQGSNYVATLQSAHCRDAQFKLLVGDNLYADVAPRVMSGGYFETIEHYHRYLCQSAYAEVWSQLPTYTTYDDHEIWNNFPEVVPWLDRTKGDSYEEYKRAGLECLRVFQAALNGDFDASDHLSYEIADVPVVDVFVADVRSGRSRWHSGGELMPGDAMRLLEEWAAGLSERPGVLVLGQPLWAKSRVIELPLGIDINPVKWIDNSLAEFGRDYGRIWKAILDAKRDILVISGDIHCSRFITLRVGDRVVHEYVCSPACLIPTEISIVKMHLSGGHEALGKWPQSSGKLKAPEEIKLGSGRKASLAAYHFGTDIPTVIGTLRFRKQGNGAVSVDAAYLDISRNGTIPASATLNGKHSETYKHCSGTNVVTLR